MLTRTKHTELVNLKNLGPILDQYKKINIILRHYKTPNILNYIVQWLKKDAQVSQRAIQFSKHDFH